MRFAIFPVHVSEVLRLPRKSDARSYKLLHLSHKITFPKLKIWCSKMQALSGNQRPDLLTYLMNMSLVLHLPRKMHLSRSSSNVPRLPSILKLPRNPHLCAHFSQGAQSLAPATRKCIWTQDRQFFNTFDLEMCFAPQQRALFRHLNFKQCSEPGFSWDSTLNPSRPLNLNWWKMHCLLNYPSHTRAGLAFCHGGGKQQDSNPGPNLTLAKPGPHLWFTRDQPASVYPRRGEFYSPQNQGGRAGGKQNTNPVQPHKAILEECNCKPSKPVHPLSPLEQSRADPHLPHKR